jgi:hypothetical protein
MTSVTEFSFAASALRSLVRCVGALCAAAFSFHCAGVHAVCLKDTPSVEQEFRTSAIVALGVARAARDVSMPDDPQGIDHTIYTVRLTRSFKGMPAGRTVRLFSENSSARFPLEPGVPYLLFIGNSKDGLYVDNCGRSGPVAEKGPGAALRRVEAIAARVRRAESQ